MIDPNFKIKEIKSDVTYGEYAIEPLESGYGYTLGHALRRVLLTSMPGIGITSVSINGVKHKFTQLAGLKENIVDLLLNIKGLCIRLPENKNSATLKISVKGTKEITGKDVTELDGAEVVNKDHYLGSISGDKGKLEMEINVERGYGYTLAEEATTHTVGEIPTDAVFSPIKRVNYKVEPTRVGRKTNLDKLILQIWTNGEISPKEALEKSAKILVSYFIQIYEPKASSSMPTEGVAISPAISEDVLKSTIEELDLPTRIYNSLRNGGIETLGQLLGTPKKDLTSMRNMGAKSISIIETKLREKGISLSV